jgi:hypothetical protein
MLKPALELVGERIIGIIVEALVFPESVDLRRDAGRAAAKASELIDSLVPDIQRQEPVPQDVKIILRIGS